MPEVQKKVKSQHSLITQVAVLFLVTVLLTGLLTYGIQRIRSDRMVTRQLEGVAAIIAKEATSAIDEYPAYHRLVRYWYEHCDELDIEYDADYSRGTRTEEKCRLLTERHPEIQLKYLNTYEFESLPEEDQKLYAEVVYSWLITRFDEIKQAFRVDYLFCVMTEEPYTDQFFLFSAADPGKVRGTNYEEVYPLGVTVTVTESQQEAMRSAVLNSSHLADAGDYEDYYSLLGFIDGHTLLIGMTYNLSPISSSIKTSTLQSTANAVIFQIILSVVCMLLMLLFVLHPLRKVQGAIRLYKETKKSEAVVNSLSELRSRNELGQLSEDVIGLTEEMDDYLSKIETFTADRERISTELNLATRIQLDMLPNIFPAFPDRHEFDIFAEMDPAKAVGGDFYDFFLIDNDHLCMVMADVSGKGIPAALFMMATKIIVASCAMLGSSAAEILTKTNEAVCSSNREQMFVTIWVGILEISTGRMKAANAGHEYPILKHADGGYELIKDKHGLVIGAMDDVQYTEYELQLEPGSKLFLYTDGAPEATDKDEKMFGLERLLAVLNEHPEANPEQTLHNVRSAIDGFIRDAEQFDDLTMLCMEYRGPKDTSTEEQTMPLTVMSSELEIDALTENLAQVQAFVDEHLEAAGCPFKVQMQVGIAVEEIFINIASYAYAPGTGKATIRVEVLKDPSLVNITFIDRGIPYDPLAKQDPDITLPADERDIGGLGIFMAKEIMDNEHYEYKDGQNIFTLTKYL